MVSLGELSRPAPELVPNLGDLPLEQQRDRLHDLYTSQSLLDAEDPSFVTDIPLADIIKMRYAALGGYVESVQDRMRHGAITDITLDTDSIEPASIFERLELADGQVRDTLLTRVVSRAGLEEARRTGSDRDGNSNTGYHGGEYEALAMKEYAITAVGDITYASVTRPNSPAIKVTPHTALLVYAPEALQEISPKSKDIMGSSGLHVFIDPRLKWQSLLATVETGTKPQLPTVGKIAISGLYSDLSFLK